MEKTEFLSRGLPKARQGEESPKCSRRRDDRQRRRGGPGGCMVEGCSPGVMIPSDPPNPPGSPAKEKGSGEGKRPKEE